MYYFYLFITESFIHLDSRLDALQLQVIEKLCSQGFTKDRIQTECFLHLRYEGTDCALMCTSKPQGKSGVPCPKHGDFEASFLER